MSSASSGGIIQMANMAGKVCIVTGANTGMGLPIARELALQGATVVMACRSEERGRAAEEKVQQALASAGGKGTATYAALDLADLDSVRAFSDNFSTEHPHVDCLINNAGLINQQHSVTKDGFETQFQVNYLSHYLLTRLLLPKLLAAPAIPSVINISSLASERGEIAKGEFHKIARRDASSYVALTAYRQSKLAQVLFTVEMHRRLGDKVTVNAVHPGIVNTELFSRRCLTATDSALPRNMSGLVQAFLVPLGWVLETTGVVYTSEKGAETALYLASSPREVTSGGGYFADCAPRPANPLASDKDLCLEWWEESARLVGLNPS